MMRRNSMDISAKILQIAIDGALKSHIVYGSNINFNVAERYLERLHQAGLITFPVINERIFKTTPKGKEYIDRYENLNNYMEGKWHGSS